MNKAFVREPEDTGKHYCPRCGSLGEAVGRATLEAHLRADAADTLGQVGFYCPAARCQVAYFDLFERLVLIDALTHPVYPKDRDAPICGCFGLTEDDVDADLGEGVVTRVREAITKAKSPHAYCESAAANGRSCIGEIQRYYMTRRAKLD